MKKQFWVNSFVYFVTLVSACLINLIVANMVLKFVSVLIEMDYFTGSVIYAIVSFLVVPGLVGVMSFYNSFKNAEFYLGRTCAHVAMGGLFHLIVSVPLMFYPFIAGGTRYLAGIIDMGIYFDGLDRVEDIYLWSYLIAFAIYLIAEIIAAVVCGILGKKKRLDDRKKLQGFSA